MKILVVSNMYPSTNNPSYGIFVKNITNELLTFFSSVDLITKYKSKDFLEKAIDYWKFYSSAISKTVSGEYDIIYIHYLTHSFPPVLLGKIISHIRKKSPTKIVVHVHGSDLLPESLTTYFLLFLQKPFFKLVNAWVVPSRYYQKVLENFLGHIYKPILIYPSGGVNTRLFKPIKKDLAKSKLGFQKDEFVVGWVSRIDKGKGWNVLLNAIHKITKHIPNLKLLVAGSGNEEKLFKEKVKELELEKRVIMLGQRTHEELPIIYSAMDVFVFPTIRRAESLGLVGLEALSCGTPVIASNIGGITDYISDGENGLLFEAGSSLELAEKLFLFYKYSENKKETLQRAARKVALEYDSKKVSKKLIEFFRMITD